MWPNRHGAGYCACPMHPYDSIPIVHMHFVECSVAQNSQVVDQNVDSSHITYGRSCHIFDLFGVTYISAMRKCIPAGG